MNYSSETEKKKKRLPTSVTWQEGQCHIQPSFVGKCKNGHSEDMNENKALFILYKERKV